MTSEPYQRKVSYLFEAAGYMWEATEWTSDSIYIEDTRKNGQEDCHLAGAFVRNKAGEWELDDDYEHLIEELGELEVKELIKFLTEHGTPDISHTVRLNGPHQALLTIKGLVGPQKDDAVAVYPIVSEYTVAVSRSDINKMIHIDLVGVI